MLNVVQAWGTLRLSTNYSSPVELARVMGQHTVMHGSSTSRLHNTFIVHNGLAVRTWQPVR